MDTKKLLAISKKARQERKQEKEKRKQERMQELELDEQLLENQPIKVREKKFEIKKASNHIVIDAKGMELKNIFLGIILASKLDANHKINAQAI